MADLRQAAQQALEALETISTCYVGDHDETGECASCHESSYLPHAPDCKKQNSITALRAALAQEEQFISLQELAEALGQPDVDSDSEIDKDDMLDMVELQRDLLYHAISLNSKMRKRKT